jgi:hypothetical protein
MQSDATPPGRPGADEFLPYFGRYIDLVPEGDLLATLERQVDDVCAALEGVDPVAVAIRPLPASGARSTSECTSPTRSVCWPTGPSPSPVTMAPSCQGSSSRSLPRQRPPTHVR